MALSRFKDLFQCSRAAVIGMIHVKALPGTPLNRHGINELVEMARQEAFAYKEAGVEVRSIIPKRIPCGIQILAGGNKEALAVGKACGLQFIRAECFVFSHVADEGLMNACAGPLLRYRRSIGAEDVLVFTDIKKKHSAHSITSDVGIADTAEAAKFFLADGVILTGSATGQEADHRQLENVISKVDLPVLIGSGVTSDNVHKYMDAHGFIVGSHFKTGGSWMGDLEYEKIESFTTLVRNLRKD
ncbi:putative uncharacterized protein F13E9.13, mitochondrial-like [Penaeus vannamei]|uniref:BtpA domain containing protein n=1 Tax=Penaeus vannamei TaxID=6689 RepID=A0A423TYI8_PENVA|nr:putative uncharacterized protein F13E9.13, mitochondrial-like [Penaeus vannamei]